MDRDVFLPTWLSVLLLAVALFVPLGTLISDTATDMGDRQSAAHDISRRFAPAEANGGGQVEQSKTGRLDRRV